MIELLQQDNLLIGAKDAICALEQKDHARILVASDSHNHFNILTAILQQFGPTCDCFAFCGDGLSDIANIFSLAQADESLRSCIPPVIAFVSGNCDPSSYPVSAGRLRPKEIKAPPRQIISVNGHNIMITHGHREGIEYGFENYGLALKMENCTTGLFGHTHIAELSYEGNYRFINPGSCSNPRGGQPQSFAILTVEKTFVDAAFLMIEKKPGEKDNYKLWTPN